MNASIQPRSSSFGMAGCLIGLLALIVAVLPPLALPKIFPPQPREQVVADTNHADANHRIKDRIVERLKGLTHRQPGQTGQKEQQNHQEKSSELEKWSDTFMISSVSLALLAISLAVFAILRQEPHLYAGVAATFGVFIIAYQLLNIVIGLAISAIIGTIIFWIIVSML